MSDSKKIGSDILTWERSLDEPVKPKRPARDTMDHALDRLVDKLEALGGLLGSEIVEPVADGAQADESFQEFLAGIELPERGEALRRGDSILEEALKHESQFNNSSEVLMSVAWHNSMGGGENFSAELLSAIEDAPAEEKRFLARSWMHDGDGISDHVRSDTFFLEEKVRDPDAIYLVDTPGGIASWVEQVEKCRKPSDFLANLNTDNPALQFVAQGIRYLGGDDGQPESVLTCLCALLSSPSKSRFEKLTVLLSGEQEDALVAQAFSWRHPVSELPDVKSKDPNVLFQLAKSKQRRGDAAGAAQLYLQLAQTGPSKYFRHLFAMKAAQLLVGPAGSPTDGAQALLLALEEDTHDPMALGDLEIALIETGDQDALGRYYREIATAVPEQKSAFLLRRAMTEPNTSRYESLRNLTQKLPDDWTVLSLFQRVSVQKGESLDSYHVARIASSLSEKKWTSAWEQLALEYALKADGLPEEELYEEVYERLGGAEPQVRLWLAHLFADSGENIPAKDMFEIGEYANSTVQGKVIWQIRRALRALEDGDSSSAAASLLSHAKDSVDPRQLIHALAIAASQGNHSRVGRVIEKLGELGKGTYRECCHYRAAAYHLRAQGDLSQLPELLDGLEEIASVPFVRDLALEVGKHFQQVSRASSQVGLMEPSSIERVLEEEAAGNYQAALECAQGLQEELIPPEHKDATIRRLHNSIGAEKKLSLANVDGAWPLIRALRAESATLVSLRSDFSGSLPVSLLTLSLIRGTMNEPASALRGIYPPLVFFYCEANETRTLEDLAEMLSERLRANESAALYGSLCAWQLVQQGAAPQHIDEVFDKSLRWAKAMPVPVVRLFALRWASQRSYWLDVAMHLLALGEYEQKRSRRQRFLYHAGCIFTEKLQDYENGLRAFSGCQKVGGYKDSVARLAELHLQRGNFEAVVSTFEEAAGHALTIGEKREYLLAAVYSLHKGKQSPTGTLKRLLPELLAHLDGKPQELLALADIALQQRAWDSAALLLEKCLSFFSEKTDLLLVNKALGKLFTSYSPQPHRASRVWKSVTKLEPDDSNAWLHLAKSSLVCAEITEAKHAAQQVLEKTELIGRLARAHYVLSRVAVHEDNSAAFGFHLERCLAYDPLYLPAIAEVEARRRSGEPFLETETASLRLRLSVGAALKQIVTYPPPASALETLVCVHRIQQNDSPLQKARYAWAQQLAGQTVPEPDTEVLLHGKWFPPMLCPELEPQLLLLFRELHDELEQVLGYEREEKWTEQISVKSPLWVLGKSYADKYQRGDVTFFRDLEKDWGIDIRRGPELQMKLGSALKNVSEELLRCSLAAALRVRSMPLGYTTAFGPNEWADFFTGVLGCLSGAPIFEEKAEMWSKRLGTVIDKKKRTQLATLAEELHELNIDSLKVCRTVVRASDRAGLLACGNIWIALARIAWESGITQEEAFGNARGLSLIHYAFDGKSNLL